LASGLHKNIYRENGKICILTIAKSRKILDYIEMLQRRVKRQ
jgi:hypothetical protein